MKMWLGRLRCAKLYKGVDMTGSDIRMRNCKFWNITVGFLNVRRNLIGNVTFSFTPVFVTYRRPVGMRPWSLPQMLILHSADLRDSIISVRCLYIYFSYGYLHLMELVLSCVQLSGLHLISVVLIISTLVWEGASQVNVSLGFFSGHCVQCLFCYDLGGDRYCTFTSQEIGS